MSRKRADDMAVIETTLLSDGDEAIIETIPPEERTPEQQAQLDAHKQDNQELSSSKAVDQLPQPEPEEQESKKSDEEKDEKPLTEKVVDAKDNVVSTTTTTVNNVRSFLKNAARPGTILLPVGILIFLYFVVVPVNGNSRLQWLWLVLTNNASLPGQPTNPNGGTNFGGGAGGTFGGPPPQPNQQSNTATPTIEQPPATQPTYHGNEEID